MGISSSGVIAGDISNDAGTFGWLLSKGQLSSLNDPDGPAQSIPLHLSSTGRSMAGQYLGASGEIHGYVATLTPGGA